MRKVIGKRNKSFYVDETKKYKMVKSHKGWLVIGLSVLGMMGIFGVTDTQVQAAEWTPNSVEQIANRIKPGQTSLEFEYGDTVWNIGLALNIKDPMQLLYDNGFKDGEQYSIQVGTIISWDGNHVTVTDPTGEVIGDSIVTDDQKHNPDQTVAGQESDTPKNPVTNMVTNGAPSDTASNGSSTNNSNSNQENNTNPGGSTGNNTGNNESKPNPGEGGGSTGENETPKPDPEKPTPTPEQTELEKLQAHLADLKKQLTVAEQELADAQKALESAQNNNVDELTEAVANQKAVVEQAKQNVAAKEDALAALQPQLESAQAAVDAAQLALDNIQPELQEQQLAATNAATALTTATQAQDELIKRWTDKYLGIDPLQDESRDTDPELFDKIKASAEAVTTATQTKSQADADLAETQEIANNMQANVNRRQAAVNEIKQQIETATSDVATANATLETESTKLAELEKQLDTANNIGIPALEQSVKDAQAKVNDLKNQIKETEAKIADIQLKVDRQKAVNQIKGFTYLTQDLWDGYIARINKTLTIDEIKMIVAEASDKNDELKAQWEADEAARKLQEAKDATTKAINALSYLSEEEKSVFLDQVNNAETIDAVKTIQINAEAKDAELKVLSDSKTKAITEINKMTHLSSSEKSDFIEQVKSADSTDTVAKVKENATKLNEQHKEEAEQARLEALREEARGTINGLRYLSNSEKQGFINQLPGAKTDKAIAKVVTDAKAKNDANHQAEIEAAELEELRANSIDDVNAMTWLSSSEKVDFVAQLKAATTKDAVVKVLTAAQKQDAANEQAHLTTVYNEAKATINGLTYLSSTEKSSYLKQLDGVKNSESQMKAVVAAAQAQDQANKEVLENAKTTAIAKINDLTFLLESRRSEFIAQINAATSTSKINAIVEQATEENNDAKDLDTYKADAVAEAKLLTNISSEQLNDAIDKINAATTKSQVNSILDDLKALDDQIAEEKLSQEKERTNAAIDQLEFLSSSQKKEFKDKVDSASTIAAIQEIFEEASTLNDVEKDKGTIIFKVVDEKNNQLKTIEKRVKAGSFDFTLKELGFDETRYVLISGETYGEILAQEEKTITLKIADKKNVETFILKAFNEETGELIKTRTLYVVGGELVEISSTDVQLDPEEWEPYSNVTYPSRQAIAGKTTEYEFEFVPRRNFLDDEQEAIAQATIVKLINAYRLENGLSALNFDTNIEKAAMIRAQELTVLYSHTRPDGRNSNSVLDDLGIDYNMAGENITAEANKITDGKKAAQRLFENWKGSATHNAAMLSQSYNNVGIGVVATKDGIYGATVFTEY